MDEPPSGTDQPADAVRVTLSGDVDIMRRRELDQIVAGFRRSDARDIVLDLAEVPFLDSTGLTMLVQLQHLAEERGGRVQVVASPAPVRRALAITGVDRLVEIAPRSARG